MAKSWFILLHKCHAIANSTMQTPMRHYAERSLICTFIILARARKMSVKEVFCCFEHSKIGQSPSDKLHYFTLWAEESQGIQHETPVWNTPQGHDPLVAWQWITASGLNRCHAIVAKHKPDLSHSADGEFYKNASLYLELHLPKKFLATC